MRLNLGMVERALKMRDLKACLRSPWDLMTPVNSLLLLYGDGADRPAQSLSQACELLLNTLDSSSVKWER